VALRGEVSRSEMGAGHSSNVGWREVRMCSLAVLSLQDVAICNTQVVTKGVGAQIRGPHV
jgi:hypothetical protein